MNMERFKRSQAVSAIVAAAAMLGAALVSAPAAHADAADTNPDVQIAAFWNSDEDLSDTVYMSTNGTDFKKLSTAYQADGNYSQHVSGAPSYVNALHDPGLFYTNGNFWMISGFVQNQPGLGYRFTPMLGSSSNLINWSYPGSGSDTNLAPTQLPPRAGADGSFDTAGTDAMADGDGSAWIVTTLGYYATNHGDNPQNDTMKPYIVRATGLQPGGDQAVNPGARPNISYGELVPINLPDNGTNWLDPSLYKENGTYYLSIKKDGITNQIYSIADLSQAQNPSAWTLVNANVVTGYEGPSLSKFKGKYFMYTDKLKDYPYGHADGTAGEFVTESANLRSSWSQPKRITTTDQNGTSIPNRHGSVVTITDPSAKAVVWNLAKSLGYSDDSDGSNNGSNGTDDLYTDVDSSTSHAEDIVWLSKQGITTGYPDGSFGVGVAVYRQDMAAFLYRLAGSPAYTPSAEDKTRFTDVNDGTAHAKEIWWLASTGITTGYPDGSFGVGVPVYRQDMAAFLKRYADQFGGPAATGEGKAFTDVDSSTPHAEDIAWLAKTGVTTGYPDGSFGVGVVVYRQDMAAFLHRMSIK